MTNVFMVFDVESVGLHGDAFAVAWFVVDRGGKRLGSACYWCDADQVEGDPEGRKWVAENVRVPGIGHVRSAYEVRSRFWDAWEETKRVGGVLVADCAWPVEARFLIACVEDDIEARRWEGPYPLHDLASIRLAAGLDPLAYEERLPLELPAHNPEADTRQSARLLIEALNILDQAKATATS